MQVVFSNRNLEASHSERIHLSNLVLLCYYHQLLLASPLGRTGLEAHFLDFLCTNRSGGFSFSSFQEY